MRDKGIISLAVIFGVGFFALATALTLTTGIIVELIKDRNIVSGDRSFYTAETASREGVYQYIENDSASGNLPLTVNNIPPSSISFSISPSPRGWAYREAEGDAGNNLTNRKIRNTLLLFPAGATFDYAVYSESNLTIKGGNNNVIIGDIFSNTGIGCDGNPDIQGNAYSAGPTGSIDDCEDNADSINEDIKIIPSPEIDLTLYQNAAQNNPLGSTYFTDADDGENYLNNQTHTFPYEVIFVDDNINEINIQNANLTGSLVVKGNLQLSGGTTINASDDYAAIIVEGNLRITGDTTIYGLVYVTETTNFSGGNNSIYGSLISVGGTETDIAGSVTIDYEALSGPPGGIVILEDPKIINWWEE